MSGRNRVAFASPIAQTRLISRGSSRHASASPSKHQAKQDELYRKDMYLVFARNALQQRIKGKGADFDQLVSHFNPNNIRDGSGAPAPELKLWLSALSHVVSGLEKVHSPLVDALVSLPWTTMDAAFVKTYISFTGVLVSARPEYLVSILSKIASGFTFQSGLRALNFSGPEGSSSPMTRRTIYDRLHELLQHLLTLIPTLPSSLQPLLVKNFPHKRQDRLAQVTYIRNLLRIASYCPDLRDKILATIIDRALQIDVEIQVELEDLESYGSLTNTVDIFANDPFDVSLDEEQDPPDGTEDDDGGDDDLSDISSDPGSMEQGEEPTDPTHVIEMVHKLDATLKLLFDFFQKTQDLCNAEISEDLQYEDPAYTTRRSQFLTLLTIFDRTILKTFKSRYTQFLLFWYSSLDPEFADLFQGLLVSRALLEQTQPVVTRAAATSYLASYVSRAEFVEPEVACTVVGMLCDYLETRLDELAIMTDAQIAPSVSQFTLFYAVCQAVFLIFCFRWRDFKNDGGAEDDMDDFSHPAAASAKWIPALDVVKRAITSPLNPLKVCSGNVVHQFAKVGRATDFIYCHDIIASNRRSDYNYQNAPVPQATATPKRPSAARNDLAPASPLSLVVDQDSSADLHTFFPFDPYRLPQSLSYVEATYRTWDSVAITDDEDDEEDDDDDDEGGIRPTGMFPIMTVGSVEDELGVSFDAMSISPVRHLAVYS